MLGVLLVSYASSLRAYVDQRRHVASLEDSITGSRADIEALKRVGLFNPNYLHLDHEGAQLDAND